MVSFGTDLSRAARTGDVTGAILIGAEEGSATLCLPSRLVSFRGCRLSKSIRRKLPAIHSGRDAMRGRGKFRFLLLALWR